MTIVLLYISDTNEKVSVKTVFFKQAPTLLRYI